MRELGKIAPVIKVSVVVPVYNVERYIARCIGNLTRQTLRDIEIICVDDGSTDATGKLLDELGKTDGRIRVIHQSNGGAGVARNVGLSVAGGEYVFFFDPDDSCSRHMLKGMYRRAKKTNADIVIAGKCVVDAETGAIHAKYGFHRNIWTLRQPFAGRDMAEHVFTLAKSVPWDKLFRRSFIEAHGLRFQNTRRSNDVFFVDMALALAERIALVPRAYYRYSAERAGSLQSAKDKTPLVFLEAYEALEKGLHERGLFCWSGKCFARVLWRTALFNMRAYKSTENLARCYERVRSIMLRLRSEVDLSDDALLPPKTVALYRVMLAEPSPDKLASIIHRRGLDPDMDDHADQVSHRIGMKGFLRRLVPIPLRELVKIVRVRVFGNLSLRTVDFEALSAWERKAGFLVTDFMTLSEDRIAFEFSYYSMESHLPEALPGAPSLAYDCAGAHTLFEVVPGEACAVKANSGGITSQGRHFLCTVRLERGRAGAISWNFGTGTRVFNWQFVHFGLYAPLTTKRRKSYCRRCGWIVQRAGDRLLVVPDTFFSRLRCRLALSVEAVMRPSKAEAKAALLSAAATFLRAVRRRPLWIFSDRPDRADDNARALFEYACSERTGPDAPQYVFAVSRNSPDFAALSNTGRCVDINGIWYKVLFLASDMIISAYRTPVQRRPFPKDTAEFLKWFFAFRYRFGFIKHGVNPYNMAAELGRHYINARIVTATTRGEYMENIGALYGYTRREVKLCGLARYDKLYDDQKMFITFMPTWRSYLTLGAGTNMLDAQNPFAESDFCKYYKAVLGDDAFVDECRSLGYKIRLMIHPNMMTAVDDLGVSASVELVYPGVRYRDVFATSSIIVTDYSSVAFDMAYLKKPVVYYQFDEKEFFSRQYKLGFFEWRRDGFGEVETSAEALKERVIEYLKNGCKMKPTYRKRVDDFFAFTDKNNCKRIYEAIYEAMREDSKDEEELGHEKAH